MAVWSVTEPRRLDVDEKITNLNVRLNAARLVVVGTDGPPQVEFSKTAAIPIRVSLDGGVLTIEHETVRTWPGLLEPLWWMINGRARFDSDVSVAVPYETLAQLWVASGSVTASGLRADLVAECVSGRVTIFGIVGALRAKVVSGPIEVLGCMGRVQLETVSGEITLADTSSANVHAKTVSGALTADLDNPPEACDIKLETINGEITVRVPDDSNLRVSLNATHGKVSSEFPGIPSVGGWGSSANGRIGDPARGGHLACHAVGGNIALLRRPTDADFDVEDRESR
ncbi:MAG TPA: DUF4097 family beta strand repeat-containing protein [Micromonosporaceae bacterium]|nr:DUF4097 family beta strand repeat-containing protein [Micromonosporaceae bacterium]